MESVVSALLREKGTGGTECHECLVVERLSLMEYHEYLDTQQRLCGGRFRTRLEFRESLDK